MKAGREAFRVRREIRRTRQGRGPIGCGGRTGHRRSCRHQATPPPSRIPPRTATGTAMRPIRTCRRHPRIPTLQHRVHIPTLLSHVHTPTLRRRVRTPTLRRHVGIPITLHRRARIRMLNRQARTPTLQHHARIPMRQRRARSRISQRRVRIRTDMLTSMDMVTAMVPLTDTVAVGMHTGTA